jgi:hypothetical protein
VARPAIGLFWIVIEAKGENHEDSCRRIAGSSRTIAHRQANREGSVESHDLGPYAKGHEMNVLKIIRKLFLLITVLPIATNSTALAQETTYFTDVNATYVPQNAFAHLLDAEFGDVDNDGDLDVVAALEFSANRIYLNDGTGKLTRKKGVFQEKKHDTEEVKLVDFDKDGNFYVNFVAEKGGRHEFYLGVIRRRREWGTQW